LLCSRLNRSSVAPWILRLGKNANELAFFSRLIRIFALYSFSRYKEQYRANLKLALPVVMSQVGQILVQFADNAMVGQFGGDDPLPLAAVSFGGAGFLHPLRHRNGADAGG